MRQEKVRINSLGEAIKVLRVGRCITQKKLASMCGIDKSSISKFEHDDCVPTFGTFYKLLNVLNPHKDLLRWMVEDANKDIPLYARKGGL
jgi:transcriptional regulator with XRE-family HTH domain